MTMIHVRRKERDGTNVISVMRGVKSALYPPPLKKMLDSQDGEKFFRRQIPNEVFRVVSSSYKLVIYYYYLFILNFKSFDCWLIRNNHLINLMEANKFGN